MKQIMGIQKKQSGINHNLDGIDDINFNWDSFETMALVYNEKILLLEQALNKLSIMDDAKLIIRICSEIRLMRNKLKQRR
jgi:hypothetical protein